jgi:hypothetical protein
MRAALVLIGAPAATAHGLIQLTGSSRHYKEPRRGASGSTIGLGLCGSTDCEDMTTRTKLYWVAILYFAEGFPRPHQRCLPFSSGSRVRLADIDS